MEIRPSQIKLRQVEEGEKKELVLWNYWFLWSRFDLAVVFRSHRAWFFIQEYTIRLKLKSDLVYGSFWCLSLYMSV